MGDGRTAAPEGAELAAGAEGAVCLSSLGLPVSPSRPGSRADLSCPPHSRDMATPPPPARPPAPAVYPPPLGSFHVDCGQNTSNPETVSLCSLKPDSGLASPLRQAQPWGPLPALLSLPPPHPLSPGAQPAGARTGFLRGSARGSVGAVTTRRHPPTPCREPGPGPCALPRGPTSHPSPMPSPSGPSALPLAHGPTYPSAGCALEAFTTPLPSVPDILLPDARPLPLPLSRSLQLPLLLEGAGRAGRPPPAAPAPGSGAAPGQPDGTAGPVRLPPPTRPHFP